MLNNEKALKKWHKKSREEKNRILADSSIECYPNHEYVEFLKPYNGIGKGCVFIICGAFRHSAINYDYDLNRNISNMHVGEFPIYDFDHIDLLKKGIVKFTRGSKKDKEDKKFRKDNCEDCYEGCPVTWMDYYNVEGICRWQGREIDKDTGQMKFKHK